MRQLILHSNAHRVLSKILNKTSNKNQLLKPQLLLSEYSQQKYPFSTKSRKKKQLQNHPLFDEETIKKKLADVAKSRKEYKQQVHLLRKQYQEELSQKAKLDFESDLKTRKQQQLETQKRRHAKLLKAIESEKNQRAKQAEQNKKFQEHLQFMQVRRDARNKRYEQARHIALQELEEESRYWICSEEEIQEVLGDEARMQEFWNVTNSTIGIPPSDATYWRFASQTADMSRTYPTRKELLWNDLLDDIYQETNLDTKYWTNEKQNEIFVQEQRAKLQAMVRREGRSRLLQQQLHYLKHHFYSQEKLDQNKSKNVPIKLPPPDLTILGNEAEMENQGAKALLENPEQFLEISNGKVTCVKHEYWNEPDQRPFPLFISADGKQDTTTITRKQLREMERKHEKLAQDDFNFDESNTSFIDKYDGQQVDETENCIVSPKSILYQSEITRYTEQDMEYIVKKLEEKLEIQTSLQKMQQSNQNVSQQEENHQEEEIEIDLEKANALLDTLNQEQLDALETLQISNALKEEIVSVDYIMQLVMNITDGRFGGTKLSQDDAKLIVLAEKALVDMTDAEIEALRLESETNKGDNQNDEK